MVYQTSSGPTWKMRVTDRKGRSRVCSTGTTDRRTADDVEAMVKRFRKRRQWAPLDAIVADRAKLAAVYDADVEGRLDELLRGLDVADLSPMVDEWAKSGANAKYVTQVRRFIPAGEPFPASGFTRKNISAFIAGLTRIHRIKGDTGVPVSDQTKNHYRSALSVFAQWLIEREVLETNPVRDVKSRPAPGPKESHLELDQAKALIAALPRGQHQALEALLCGTGIELGAALEASRRDLDMADRTLRCFPRSREKEGKTKYRQRVVEITEDWCWAYIEPYVAALPPNARLFTVDGDKVHKVHDRIVRALRLPPVTLHDWRHTYAVTALKRDDNHQDIKRQLGHAPQSTLIYTTYGVYTTKPKGRRQREKEAREAAERAAREAEAHKARETDPTSTHR